MTDREAMKLALEALEECRRDPRLKYEHPFYDKTIAALRTAIKAAERSQALDKMAENARELGLDYNTTSDERLMKMPEPTEFYHHVVENEGDWSEWVNPNNDSYFMKCCDCGLVHEMQFKVVKYSENDECDFVGDPDLQPVFRARRVTPQPQRDEAPARAVEWVWLTDEERNYIWEKNRTTLGGWDHGGDEVMYDRHFEDAVIAIEAKLKEKNND
jgi:hypothetical protein